MFDVEIPIAWSADDQAREVERYLRAWFEIVLDQMREEALRHVRDECRQAAPSRANEEIAERDLAAAGQPGATPAGVVQLPRSW